MGANPWHLNSEKVRLHEIFFYTYRKSASYTKKSTMGLQFANYL